MRPSPTDVKSAQDELLESVRLLAAEELLLARTRADRRASPEEVMDASKAWRAAQLRTQDLLVKLTQIFQAVVDP